MIHQEPSALSAVPNEAQTDNHQNQGVNQMAMPDLNTKLDTLLNYLAKKRNARVKRWWGVQATSSRRLYRCYLCGGRTIDTESGAWHRTARTIRAVADHREERADEIDTETGRAILAALIAGRRDVADQIYKEQ